eukprot:9709420-Alexandrium_andersonii.AAC.1
MGVRQHGRQSGSIAPGMHFKHLRGKGRLEGGEGEHHTMGRVSHELQHSQGVREWEGSVTLHGHVGECPPVEGVLVQTQGLQVFGGGDRRSLVVDDWLIEGCKCDDTSNKYLDPGREFALQMGLRITEDTPVSNHISSFIPSEDIISSAQMGTDWNQNPPDSV